MDAGHQNWWMLNTHVILSLDAQHNAEIYTGEERKEARNAISVI